MGAIAAVIDKAEGRSFCLKRSARASELAAIVAAHGKEEFTKNRRPGVFKMIEDAFVKSFPCD